MNLPMVACLRLVDVWSPKFWIVCELIVVCKACKGSSNGDDDGEDRWEASIELSSGSSLVNCKLGLPVSVMSINIEGLRMGSKDVVGYLCFNWKQII